MRTLLNPLLNLLGFELVQKAPEPRLKVKHFLDLYFARVPDDFYFLAIGAYDGKHHDPLYQYVTRGRLRGTSLEPQPTVFKDLVENYRDYPVTCVNAAIAERKGTRTLYTSPETSLASFMPIPGGTPIEVPTLAIEDLELPRITFLQIDCEGYDWEILKRFDFNKYQPEIINFESVLLSPEDQKAAEALLTSQGYKFFRYERDTLAYKI